MKTADDTKDKAVLNSPFLDTTIENLKSTLGAGEIEFEDIYRYLNIFMCSVKMPAQPDTDSEREKWIANTVRPMISAIFEPVYTSKYYMSSLTWILAPRTNITKGAFGSSGGGGRTVGDTMILADAWLGEEE